MCFHPVSPDTKIVQPCIDANMYSGMTKVMNRRKWFFPHMGVARIIFREGGIRFQKKVKKIFTKVSNNFLKISKILKKFSKKFLMKIAKN